ncbi:uncharacterized protein LOC134209420 [Armigeres subalbatus]|uniref:uncharacterized protein LOC134209420 n=1 Tax=Armigeres subalbatus TaxID=124917 RepID=UPI002ECFE69D
MRLPFCISILIGCAVAEFLNPYPPVAALFGPRDKFICNAVVLGKGKILTSADCVYLKKNGSHSPGMPEEFHVALETHTIGQFQRGKGVNRKDVKRRYLEKLSQKFGKKYDNKYGNELLSDKLKPEELNFLKKVLQSNGVGPKPSSSNFVPVLNYKFHPEFNRSDQFTNDLVVLEVPERFPTENNSIAELSPTSAELAFNRVVQVHGFGILSHGANEKNRPSYFKIRTVEMYLLPPMRCQEVLNDLFKPDQHLCLMPKWNETLCMGFTGAPIVLEGKLIGIVEFGHRSCSLKLPVIGIRLDTFRNSLGLANPLFLDLFLKLATFS